MTFVSYAQNMEDVMLWRALKHIKSGFYIDVGAHDPEQDSVTKAFYDMGWHGINIEPVFQWFDKLVAARPKDVNLQLAAGSEHGELTFYEIVDTGLSTVDRSIAGRHEVDSGYKKIERKVSVETLTNICNTYNVIDVHFLKIDVEGYESQVVEGINFEKIRPWIIVIESVSPNTQMECYKYWEPSIINFGYIFAYFDGINRYYISEEHKDLMDSFVVPPNYFDNFFLSETVPYCFLVKKKITTIQLSLDQLKHELHEINNDNKQIQHKLCEVKNNNRKLYDVLVSEVANNNRLNQLLSRRNDEIFKLQSDINSFLNSKSWRLTFPLRQASKFLKKGYNFLKKTTDQFNLLVKRSAIFFMEKSVKFVLSRPILTCKILAILKKYPNLSVKLKHFIACSRSVNVSAINVSANGQMEAFKKNNHMLPEGDYPLTLRAHRIHQMLNANSSKNSQN